MRSFFYKKYNNKSNSFGNRFLRIANLLAIVGFVFFFPASYVMAQKNLMASISSDELTLLANKERINMGLPALEPNPILQKAAELKVNDMKQRGYFSHNSPDGKLPWYWLERAGYGYVNAGENLMTGFFVSSEAVKAWMDSPLHRKNILGKEYTQVGTAVVQGVYKGKETVFAVQFFGSPKPTFPETRTVYKPLTAAPPSVVKVSTETNTELFDAKKIAKVEENVIPSPKPEKKSETSEYPRIYYAYDNGNECVVV